MPIVEVLVVERPDPDRAGRVVHDSAAIEKAVDADIEAFNKYFQEAMGNDPLVPSERAIVKTYLWWKTRGESTNAG